jgi:O-antigen/teichoic acid export membrane protein
MISKIFNFRKFETETESGRESERNRLIRLSIAVNFLSKLISMLVMVYVVASTVPYLGAERFGVWMTILGFVGVLSFLDLGAGNSLTNMVANAAKKGEEELTNTISAGILYMTILAIGVLIMLFIISESISIGTIIKTDLNPIKSEVEATVVVFNIIFSINIIANSIQRIVAGMQLSYLTHAVSILSSFLTAICIYFSTKNELEIPYLLLGTFGVQTIVSLLPIAWLYKKNYIKLDNLNSRIEGKFSPLFKTGGLFLILQIGTMAGWGIDPLLISGILGASAVAEFAIIQRLFQIIAQPMAIYNAPLWSAYSDAHAGQDFKFIKNTLLTSIKITAIYSIVSCIILAFIGNEIILKWTSNSVNVSLYLIVAYGLWTSAQAIGNSFAMFLNGCGLIRPQVMAVALIVGIGLPVKVYILKNEGLTAMIFAFTFIYCATLLIIFKYVYGAEIKKLTQFSN